MKKQQSDTDSNRTRLGGAAKGKAVTALAGWQCQHADLAAALEQFATIAEDLK